MKRIQADVYDDPDLNGWCSRQSETFYGDTVAGISFLFDSWDDLKPVEWGLDIRTSLREPFWHLHWLLLLLLVKKGLDYTSYSVLCRISSTCTKFSYTFFWPSVIWGSIVMFQFCPEIDCNTRRTVPQVELVVQIFHHISQHDYCPSLYCSLYHLPSPQSLFPSSPSPVDSYVCDPSSCVLDYRRNILPMVEGKKYRKGGGGGGGRERMFSLWTAQCFGLRE